MYSHVKNIIVVLLSIVLFNYCVRFDDATSSGNWVHNGSGASHIAEYNAIESVLELVTEEWLDIEDYIPEQDNNDTPEDTNITKTLVLIGLPDVYKPAAPLFSTQVIYPHFKTAAYNCWLQCPPTPPPDAV